MNRSFTLRTLALCLFTALLGFCYSITTQASSAAVRSLGSPNTSLTGARAIGSSALRFTNPLSLLVPGDYDIGDSFFGSSITRYITVAGGIRPYRLSSANLGGALASGSTLSLMSAGCLMGSVTRATLVTDLTFNVTATDSFELQAQDKTKPQTNSSPNSRFHLYLYAGGAQSFRFAVDRINDGFLGQSYAGKVEAIGGKGSTSYTIVPGSVTLNGAPFGTGNSLEAFGLTLAQDGTLFGRALKTGLVTFTAVAKDSLNRTATGRTGTAPNQVITFNIADTNVTSTDNTILNVNIKGSTNVLGKDSASFTCKINFNAATIGELGLANKRFTLLLGNNVFTGYISSTGKLINGNGGKLVFADGSSLNGVVDAVNGTIKGTVSKANLSRGLDAGNLVDHSTKRIPIGFFLCDFVIASDLVEFAVKHTGTKYSLSYTLGRVGSPVAGNFQIISLTSKDGVDIAGNPGSSWKVNFISLPRVGVDDNANFTNLADPGMEIRIGQNFSQFISRNDLIVDSKGTLVYQNKVSQVGIKSLKLKNGVFTGSLETFVITAAQTTIPPAGDPVANVNATFFNLALDILRNAPDVPFHGECSRSITKEFLSGGFNAQKKNKWIDKVQKRPH